MSKQTSPVPADERAYWLALYRVPGVGPRVFARLLERFSAPRRVFSVERGALLECGIKNQLLEALQKPDWKTVEQDMRWLETPGHSLLTLHDSAYPPRLKEIHDPPPLLFVQGDALLLSKPQLAVVGGRSPSRGGVDTAFAFSRRLSRMGLLITSGMAYGIDAAAHQGAMADGGATIAVAGTGLDKVYPREHRGLAEQILAKGGALVSEFPLGTPIRRQHFPRRNRIISGLSLGTLVVEATLHSGSLITARLAAEQNREVFAIPGSIHNPLAKGCHALLKEGAKLVENVQDIFEELRSFTPLPDSLMVNETDNDDAQESLENLPLEELNEEYQGLLEVMNIDEPVTIDELVERSGLTAEIISSMLLIMELRELVASHHGGSYIRLGRRTET